MHQTALVIVGVITVACGFYYYLKVVRAMYWEAIRERPNAVPLSGLSRLTMVSDDCWNYFPGRLPAADFECAEASIRMGAWGL